MIKKFSKDIMHYVPLFGVLAAGAIGFVVFSYDDFFQLAIISAVTISYVVWGIVHHALHKDFHWEIVVEYVVFGLLGFIVAVSLIFQK